MLVDEFFNGTCPWPHDLLPLAGGRGGEPALLGKKLHCQGRQDNPGTPFLIWVDGNDGNDVVIDGEVDGHATLTGIEMENWVHKMETSSLLVSY